MRVVLALAALCVCAAALVALLWILVAAGVERERLVAQIERQVGARLGARVEIGSLDGPLYPSLELRDVRVTWPEATLQVPRLSLRYALENLLGRTRLSIAVAAVERPSLELRGIPELPAHGKGGSSIDVALAALEIRAAEIRWVDSPLGSLTARLALSAHDWTLAGDLPLPAHGELRGSAALELAGPDAAQSPRALALHADVELAGSVLRVHRLLLDGDAGRVASHGHALLDRAGVRSVVLDATAAHLDLAPLLAMPELHTDLEGPIGVRAERGRATWRDAEANAQARLRGRAAGDAIQSIDVQATLARAALAIERAEIHGPALELRARGTLTDRADFRIAGAVPELARLEIPSLPLGRLRGALGFDGQIQGPRAALEASFDVRGSKLAVAERALGTLDVRLALRAKTLEIERATLAHGAERIELAGKLDLAKPDEPRADALRIELQKLELASLASSLHVGAPLRGRLSGRASLSGTLREPRGEAKLRLESARIDRFAAQALELEIDLAQRWRGRLRTDLEKKQGSAELRVDLPAPRDTDLREQWESWLSSPEGSLELDARGLDVALAQPFLPKTVNAASGRVDLELHAAGGWPPQALKGHARVEAFTLDVGAPSRSFGPARGTVELGPRTHATGSVDFRADLDLPDAWHGKAAGRVQLRKDLFGTRLELTDFRFERQHAAVTLSGVLERGALDPLRVEVRALDVAALPSVPGLEQLGGQLDAQFSIRGSLQQPSLSGAAVWEQPRVGSAHAERATLEWATGDGKLVGDARIIEAGAVVASAQLRAPAPSGTTSYAEVLAKQGAEARLDASDLDIGLLSPFLLGIARDLHGRVTLHAEASGDPWQPRLSGALTLREGSVRIPALGQTFAPIEAVLRAQQDTIRIESLSLGSADGGRAELSGHIGLAALLPKTLDARMTLDALGLVRTGGTRVKVDGSIALEGPLEALRFAGDLSLRESRFGVPQKDDPLAREIRILRSSSDGAALADGAGKPALWQRSSGTLRLQVPSNTWIRGAGAELELSGAIELRKQPLEEPRFFGALDVVRGQYRFSGRTLEVETGRATFTGGSKIDPQLDVRATTDVDEYHIVLQLTGPLSNPNLQPTSDPSLPRNDVLALLLFGSRSRDAGPEKALALDLALAQLGQDLAADQLSSRISSYLPFDTFRVGMAEDGNGAKLEVGRYLRKDVFVRYEQTLGTKGTSDAIVLEWRFSPTFRIESSTSTKSGTGADLIWRKDY